MKTFRPALHICKDGVVTIRSKESDPRRQGASLPFFWVDTVAEAEFLRTLLCKVNYDGEYQVYDFKNNIQDIERVRGMFQAAYNKIKNGDNKKS